MVLAEIATSLGSIKTALDILKGLKKSKASSSILAEIADLQAALIEVQQGIMAANQAHTADVERIRELEEEVARLKAWDSEKTRYELKSPWTGAMVYALKPAKGDSEPPHWLCATCYHQSKKRFLHIAHHGMTENHWMCPECKTVLMVGNGVAPQ